MSTMRYATHHTRRRLITNCFKMIRRREREPKQQIHATLAPQLSTRKSVTQLFSSTVYIEIK